jgi:hypothetical protein
VSASATAALVATRTETWTEDERAVLEAIVAALRPSARHLTDVLDWLDDIAVRESIRPGTVLAHPALARALRIAGSAPDRLKHWKEALRRLRYPRLAAREQAIAAIVRGLDLGRAATVRPPSALEGGALTVTIAAASAAELTDALERLLAGAARGDIDRLFALLDE